jgi:hypothetical protein
MTTPDFVESDPSIPEDREEGRTRQLQRLAMIGTLAAGLGHDLRNLVMPIALRLDVLGASDLPENARSNIESIRGSLDNLTRLANGLLLLSKNPFESRSDVDSTDLHEWWRDVCALVVDALPTGCMVEAEFPEKGPRVAVPPYVLAQVVLNLAMNARRAMLSQANPQVRIGSERSGDGVHLTVSDNGNGMSADVRERCFEPFFATGHRELATGLGLSAARSILFRYGADITVASQPHEGATFTLILPLARERTARELPALARIAVNDMRTAAVVRLLLKSRGVPIEETGVSAEASEADFVVCERSNLAAEQAAPQRAARSWVAVGDDTIPERVDARVSWIARSHLSKLLDHFSPEWRTASHLNAGRDQ